jgi:hypothetical protein
MVHGGFITALWLSAALLAAGARSNSVVAPAVVRRDEPVGGSCSPEGQWNCMPETWQRCAAGRWSEAMHLADGTRCTPQGLTEEVDIEHDGSVDGGAGGGSRGQSGGRANSFTAQTCLPLTTLVVWMHWRGLF